MINEAELREMVLDVISELVVQTDGEVDEFQFHERIEEIRLEFDVPKLVMDVYVDAILGTLLNQWEAEKRESE